MQIIYGNFDIVGVIGNPITHTLSPVIHNIWLEQYQIPAVYVPFHVYNDGFNDFITGIRFSNIKGLNVTIPYKEEAFRILGGNLTKTAQKAQAVNVIFRDQDGRLWGDNTDGAGLILSLKEAINSVPQTILVIGAGGASKGIIPSLVEKGHVVTLVNRTYKKSVQLIQNLKYEDQVKIIPFDGLFQDLSRYDIIINTASIDAFTPETVRAIPYQTAGKTCLFYDINYKPLITPFLQKAKACGYAIQDGLGMLIHQAFLSFKRILGRDDLVLRDTDFNTMRSLLVECHFKSV